MAKSHNSRQSPPEAQSQPAANHQAGAGPWWEQAIGGVGVLLVLGLLAFLLYEAWQPATPPEIVVSVQRVLSVEGGYLVELEARNEGESTAATVEVEGTLTAPDDPHAAAVATSSLTFDYLPSKSTRRGGLFFKEDPAQYTLEVRALGYVEP